jgi:serine/threonine protein kinase
MIPGTPEDGVDQPTWQQQLVVSADALKGLDYLHGAKIPGTGVGEDKTQCGRGIDDAAYRPAILHRDIRPSNIWMTWICAGGLLT